MPSSQSKFASSAKASQELVPIQEIRNGVVILKDGSLRMILMVSSLNFSLKSATEQDAIIMQYQNFLNSLDFSIQFFVQSRGLNIDPYLETLRERQKTVTNELLKIQTAEYITFVKEFVESTHIVTKTFYIALPFIPVSLAATKKGIMKLFGSKKSSGAGYDASLFEEYRTQLSQRVGIVIDGLARTGVRAAPLNTEELIELFYELYNPGEAEKGTAPELITKEAE